jgi:hypothetical protein
VRSAIICTRVVGVYQGGRDENGIHSVRNGRIASTETLIGKPPTFVQKETTRETGIIIKGNCGM